VCKRPRNLPIGSVLCSADCTAKRPMSKMTLGCTSATWRARYGAQAASSCGCGLRLPAGRHLTGQVM
jgi:hypothetical protein